MRHSAGAWSGKTSEVPLIPFLAPIPGCAFRRVHGSLLYSARYASSAGKVASAS